MRRIAYAAAVVALWWSVAIAAPPAPSRRAVHTVIIEGTRFVPDVLVVKAHDSIVWVNKDPFTHTVTSKDGGFDSRRIDEGKSWKYVAAQTGEFSYVCTLHPTMKGTLRVE